MQEREDRKTNILKEIAEKIKFGEEIEDSEEKLYNDVEEETYMIESLKLEVMDINKSYIIGYDNLIDTVKLFKDSREYINILCLSLFSLYKMITQGSIKQQTEEQIIININDIGKYNLHKFNSLCSIIIIILTNTNKLGIYCDSEYRKYQFEILHDNIIKYNNNFIKFDDDNNEEEENYIPKFVPRIITTFEGDTEDTEIQNIFIHYGDEYKAKYDIEYDYQEIGIPWLLNIYQLTKYLVDDNIYVNIRTIIEKPLIEIFKSSVIFEYSEISEISEIMNEIDDTTTLRDFIIKIIDELSYFVGIGGFGVFHSIYEKIDVVQSFDSYDRIVLGYVLTLLYPLIS